MTGPKKDIIIKGGHNIHPEPIETDVLEVDGVRAGCVVAAGVRFDRMETERLFVVAETRMPEAQWRDLDHRIRDR